MSFDLFYRAPPINNHAPHNGGFIEIVIHFSLQIKQTIT